jgi:hypothetical protein
MGLAARWIALLDAPRAELEARPGAIVVAVGKYGRLRGLTRITSGGLHHFFEGDEPVVVSLPRAAVGGSSPNGFFEDLGAAQELPARHVWPDRGLALSLDGEGLIAFAEVFPPTSLDDYRKRLYEAPPEAAS